MHLKAKTLIPIKNEDEHNLCFSLEGRMQQSIQNKVKRCQGLHLLWTQPGEFLVNPLLQGF